MTLKSQFNPPGFGMILSYGVNLKSSNFAEPTPKRLTNDKMKYQGSFQLWNGWRENTRLNPSPVPDAVKTSHPSRIWNPMDPKHAAHLINVGGRIVRWNSRANTIWRHTFEVTSLWRTSLASGVEYLTQNLKTLMHTLPKVWHKARISRQSVYKRPSSAQNVLVG